MKKLSEVEQEEYDNFVEAIRKQKNNNIKTQMKNYLDAKYHNVDVEASQEFVLNLDGTINIGRLLLLAPNTLVDGVAISSLSYWLSFSKESKDNEKLSNTLQQKINNNHIYSALYPNNTMPEVKIDLSDEMVNIYKKAYDNKNISARLIMNSTYGKIVNQKTNKENE